MAANEPGQPDVNDAGPPTRDLPTPSVALAIGGGGALSKIETTPLLTVEETLEALGRAQSIGYRKPGA